MNRNKFISFLENPNLLNSSSVDELNEIIEEFPFFQTAHLLLVKNFLSLNSIKYDKQLKISATYANDRIVLFHLINDDFISKEKAIINNKKENFKEIQISKEKSDEVYENELLFFDFVVNEEKETEQLQGLDIVSSYAELLESVDEKLTTNELAEKSDENRTKNPSKLKKQNFLIENFLQNNKKIVPKQIQEENEDISKQSVEEDHDLITETLVRIYIKQGYYFKAIIAYEKLSLKYPEKSIYFANQIKKIKQIINNK
ncbi:MAG: hypothetical protein KAG95_01030 [Bacteroidales bacterium]|nr:hypothetical protein [Bacteroidales bacterium]